MEESSSDYKTERTEENEPLSHQKQGPDKEEHTEEYEPKYITAVTGEKKHETTKRRYQVNRNIMEVSASENIAEGTGENEPHSHQQHSRRQII